MNPKPSLAMAVEITPRTPEALIVLDITQELLHKAQIISTLAESRLDTLLGQYRPEFPLQPEYFTHAEYFNALERPLKDIDTHLTYIAELLERLEL